MIDTIIKRDGRELPFDEDKITQAILKAFHASGSAKSEKTAERLADQVVAELEKANPSKCPQLNRCRTRLKKF